jgi:hypothetical protein
VLAFAKKLFVEYRYVALLGPHKFLRRNRTARRILRGQSADSGMVPFAPLADVGLIPLGRPEEVEQYGTLLACLGKRNSALAAARFQLEETARGPHKAGSAAAPAGAGDRLKAPLEVLTRAGSSPKTRSRSSFLWTVSPGAPSK